MKNSIYSNPKLCKSSKGWYVHFRYNGRQKRYKHGMNYIKNLTEREKEANRLILTISKSLKNGWNPFSDIEATNTQITLIEALDFSLEKKKDSLAKKTYLGYKGTVEFIKMAIAALSLDYIEIQEVKRSHIRTIMEKAKRQRKWSNCKKRTKVSHPERVKVSH